MYLPLISAFKVGSRLYVFGLLSRAQLKISVRFIEYLGTTVTGGY